MYCGLWAYINVSNPGYVVYSIYDNIYDYRHIRLGQLDHTCNRSDWFPQRDYPNKILVQSCKNTCISHKNPCLTNAWGNVVHLIAMGS